MDKEQFITKSADEHGDSDADVQSAGSDGKGYDLVKNIKTFQSQLQKQLKALKKDKKMLLSTIQKLEQKIYRNKYQIIEPSLMGF